MSDSRHFLGCRIPASLFKSLQLEAKRLDMSISVLVRHKLKSGSALNIYERTMAASEGGRS